MIIKKIIFLNFDVVSIKIIMLVFFLIIYFHLLSNFVFFTLRVQIYNYINKMVEFLLVSQFK